MVETHSYKLSPFGPALQLGGGSSVISASSFCILLADVPKAFDIFGFGLASLLSGLLSAKEEPRPRPVPLEPAPDDMTLVSDVSTPCLLSSRGKPSFAGSPTVGGEAGRRGRTGPPLQMRDPRDGSLLPSARRRCRRDNGAARIGGGMHATTATMTAAAVSSLESARFNNRWPSKQSMY